MPFTLLNNYQENQPLELGVALQARLWLYSQIIALAHSHCWKIDWFDFHLLEDTCLFYFGGQPFLHFLVLQLWLCAVLELYSDEEPQCH